MPISSPAHEQASATATTRNAVATAAGEKEAMAPVCPFFYALSKLPSAGMIAG